MDNDTFTGRMRWAEAPLALAFGAGGASLAASLLAVLSVAADRQQLTAAAVVIVIWLTGLGIIVGVWTARLRSLSLTDPLTGLFNRRFLGRRLTEEMQLRDAHPAARSALLFIDLDRLKQINDSFGHLSGDKAIVAVAQSITDCVRTTDVAARVGGDEFTVLLSRTSIADAELVAARISQTLAAIRGPWVEPLSLSIGVAPVLGSDVTTLERLLSNADSALYKAKLAGGGLVVAAAPFR